MTEFHSSGLAQRQNSSASLAFPRFPATKTLRLKATWRQDPWGKCRCSFQVPSQWWSNCGCLWVKWDGLEGHRKIMVSYSIFFVRPPFLGPCEHASHGTPWCHILSVSSSRASDGPRQLLRFLHHEGHHFWLCHFQSWLLAEVHVLPHDLGGKAHGE